MDDVLYKIIPLFTAVLGGLWYFAVLNLEKDKWIFCAVFAFAAIASVCFVNVMQRFRMAFDSYINNLNRMDGDMKVSIKPSRLPSTIFAVQLLYGQPLWSPCSASFTPRTARVKTQPLFCTGDHLGKLRPLRSRRSGRAAIRPECADTVEKAVKYSL
jgi:hypothetical protein